MKGPQVCPARERAKPQWEMDAEREADGPNWQHVPNFLQDTYSGELVKIFKLKSILINKITG